MNTGPAGTFFLDSMTGMASILIVDFITRLAGDSLSGFHDLSGQRGRFGFHG